MDELQAILECWGGLPEPPEEAVLATVVHVQGSAYRRPGARMLILPDGRRIGTISGGCLEGEVANKAGWWTSREPTALRSFDSSVAGAAWDFGLGCNGIITVLLERAAKESIKELMDFLKRTRSARTNSVIATVIRADAAAPFAVGDRAFWEDSQRVGGKLHHVQLEGAVQDAFIEGESRLVHLPEGDVFVEWLGPPQRLVIFGGGHDVIPLVAMGKVLGWDMVVADGRAAYARPERFPGASQVLVLPPTATIGDLEIDRNTAVVVMTHNYPLDLLLVPQILDRKPCYLGLLGPRTRTDNLLRETGCTSSAGFVHGPVGLDIGANHPETIALSIIAEIQAVLGNRSGGFLRRREDAIHRPVKEIGLASKARAGAGEKTVVKTCDVARVA